MTQEQQPVEPTGRPRHLWVGLVTMGVYIMIGVFPYLVSALLIPTWALVVLMGVWGVGLVFTGRLAMRRPLLSVAAIPIALVFWWVFVSAGSSVLGWTA
jgi:hypothetical protein